LKNDLEAVRKTVVDAREAVRKAAVALTQIPQVNELQPVAETTTSAEVVAE